MTARQSISALDWKAPGALTRTITARLDGALFAVFLIGLYTYVPISIGGVAAVPAAICLIPALYALGRDVSAAARFVPAFVVMSLVLAIPPLVRGGFGDPHFSGGLISGFYLVYSVGIGLLVYLCASRLESRQVKSIFSILSYGILLGAALETIGVGKEASDAFRTAMFPERFVYESLLRDVMLHGAERPKFFTAEPSFAATWLLVFSLASLIMSEGKAAYATFVLKIGMGLLIIRSPLLFAAGPLLLVHLAHAERGRITGTGLVYGGATVVIAAAVLYFAAQVFEERAFQIAQWRDASSLMRLVAPVYVALDVLKEAPLFGAGLGPRVKFEATIAQTLYDLGVSVSYLVESDTVSLAITNVFWESLILLGVAGTAIHIALIRHIFNQLFAGNVICFVYMFIFAQLMGGANSVRFWAISFLIALAVSRRLLRSTQAAAPSADSTYETTAPWKI